MKQLSEVIPNLSTQSMSEPERQQDSRRPLKVWAQLAEVFGKAFYREHGEVPSTLWVMAIARLTDQQIARGLANLANDGLEFPSNLSQFVAACKRLPPVRQLGQKYLPNPESDKREAEKAWRDMEKLAGRKLRPE